MDPQEVRQLLLEQLNGCEVEVNGDGRHFDLLIVGDCFEGLSPVKKQQLVYAVLNPWIADGRIHAVNMKTFTPAEWDRHQGH